MWKLDQWITFSCFQFIMVVMKAETRAQKQIAILFFWCFSECKFKTLGQKKLVSSLNCVGPQLSCFSPSVMNYWNLIKELLIQSIKETSLKLSLVEVLVPEQKKVWEGSFTGPRNRSLRARFRRVKSKKFSVSSCWKRPQIEHEAHALSNWFVCPISFVYLPFPTTLNYSLASFYSAFYSAFYALFRRSTK